MTRKEALVQLNLGPGITEDVSEEYVDAVDIAIKSIEAWDKLFEMLCHREQTRFVRNIETTRDGIPLVTIPIPNVISFILKEVPK